MSTTPGRSRRKIRRPFKIIFRLIQIFFALVVIFVASFLVTLAIRTPEPEENPAATNYQIHNNSEVGIAGKIERVLNVENAVNEKIRSMRHYVFIKDIPLRLRQAVIAVEDTRFYSHRGFDVEGIIRAALVNVEAGEIQQGASTITQQLVKNLFLTQERSFTRKAEEVFLAMSVERTFDKDKILEMYLNTIYFGSNFYGIYDAAHGYFGKEPKDLTVGECAMLAGLPNAPSVYSPYNNFMLAKRRQLVVIDAMVRAHMISSYEAENARIQEIVLSDGVF
ncbi:MAG: transglycosylase domain-containing protein [Selenomonadaceae bacterium]|nr:transglycosylase domain-containing protein [Selenomonadaceae bacterium]